MDLPSSAARGKWRATSMPSGCALLARMVQDALTPEDEDILKEQSPYREFGGEEKLK
jgi:hypothetical protein